MMAEQGKSVEEIVSCMKNRIGTGSVSFVPETLTYLKMVVVFLQHNASLATCSV